MGSTKQVLYILVLIFTFSAASEYFVSLDGDDRNMGTLDKPWGHIQRALMELKPGDVLTLRGGSYSEEVTVSGLQGSPGNPITFRAYAGESVVLNGTARITGSWEKYKGSIYRKSVDKDVWQLFVDDEMQVNARWPNAFWNDFSVFDSNYWGFSDKNSTFDKDSVSGVMVDNGTQNLAGSGLNATGAIGILNIGSWLTWAGHVDSHTPGQSSFKYHLDESPFSVSFHAPKCRYFLEDKLEFLDAPTEWFYDKSSKMLYLWTESGNSPEEHTVTSKVSTYAITVTNSSSWLVFSGLKFFGTTIYAKGQTIKEDVHDIKLDSLHFTYPSYSKRMLGSTAVPNTTTIYFTGDLTKQAGNFTIFNCTWEYADGQTISYRGADGVIQNNLFHHNDFTCVGDGNLFASYGARDQFIRNVIHSNGPSTGFRPGIASQKDRAMGMHIAALVRLNVFYDLKTLQNDGSHVQVQAPGQNGIIIEYNWSFSTAKRGLRFDCVDHNVTRAICGENGTMRYNVIWNTSGMSIKGDEHTIQNNLIYDTFYSYSDLYLRASPGSDDAYKGENEKTSTTSNMLQSGACSARSETTCKYPVPGQYTNNEVGSVREHLRDPDNFDFRPNSKSDLLSKGIGPYGKEITNGTYWIPGRQDWSASTPIPPNGTIMAKCDLDLMWLAGYMADAHHVYFGSSKTAVSEANTSSDAFLGKFSMPVNVAAPKVGLTSGVEYFWRVDAVTGATTVHAGAVWTFKCSG